MYGGELIHQSSDEFGSIEVVELQQKIRSLHFGNKTQQSAMLLNQPYILIHKYAQAMVVPLCWTTPRKVLVLGLGSGSIVKYLYNYFQDLKIDAVELRPAVIQIASEYFLLPDCDERFNIFNESAFDWINRQEEKKTNENEKYDLIIVDMFLTSRNGKDITVDTSSNIKKLTNLLSENGVIAFNQLGQNITGYSAFDALLSVYLTHQLYSINIDSANNILFASRSTIPSNINDETFQYFEKNYSSPYKYYFENLFPVFG